MAQDPRTSDGPSQIVGRTGSLFTRLPLIFAEELCVAYELVISRDLTSLRPDDYAGNPALRLPILQEGDTTLFGSLNICRAVSERATRPAKIVWPEDLRDAPSRNAQELVWHCMTAQVQTLMAVHVGSLPANDVYLVKARAGFEGALAWLDKHAAEVLSALPPERSLSFFEVALYCLIDHLRFGPTVPIGDYASLLSFAHQFGERQSVRNTAYQ